MSVVKEKPKRTACIRSDTNSMSLMHMSASLSRIRVVHTGLDTNIVQKNLKSVEQLESAFFGQYIHYLYGHFGTLCAIILYGIAI
jgi:hypothetical protein